MTDPTPYTVPQEPGRWRAIALAVLVHLALFAFLWIGVHWQSNAPTTIEAEVWSPQPREAAPAPEPVKQPEPVRPPPPPVAQQAPKPVVKEPPVENPDIALEREKKRKADEERKRQEAERQARLKQKAEEERQAKLKQKAEEERLAKQKAEQQRIAKQQAEKRKAEEAKRKQEDAQMARVRDEEMKRITSGVTGEGGAGSATKAQGGHADGSYAQRVAAKIKSNITFSVPDDLTANPPVEYEVDLLPDGSISGIHKLKSSGVPGFDEAVLRAIQKSQPYPKDKSGSVPSSFIGIHKPKDQ